MVDLIEFPTNKVVPDSLPQAGDTYEAYGLAHKFKPPMICFVFADGRITALPYDGLSLARFRPLGGADDCDGECVLSLAFGKKPGDGAAVVVVTGRNLNDFFAYLGHHRVHWLWELPEHGAAADEGSPAVHSIAITEADSRALAELLAND